MYIVRDKATRKILHVNPAPISQRLQDSDIYYKLDRATMEVGSGELPDVPEDFDIDAHGAIVPWTLERQIQEGRKQLAPEAKLVAGRVVAKTSAELVSEGILELATNQVVDGDLVREMTVGEQVAAGVLVLDPGSIVVDDQIVSKPLDQLVKEGLVALAIDEKVQGDEIVKLTPRDMLDLKRFDLKRYKQLALQRSTEASLAARRDQVADHELLYAALGAYDATTTANYKKIAADHANALRKIATAIDAAATADEVDTIVNLGAWPKPGGTRVAQRPASKLELS